MSNLEELRKSWESKMEIITELSSNKDRLLVVLKTGGRYYLNRYFTIGPDNWVVSVDAGPVKADDIFQALAKVV
jgi:hypothetical protein